MRITVHNFLSVKRLARRQFLFLVSNVVEYATYEDAVHTGPMNTADTLHVPNGTEALGTKIADAIFNVVYRSKLLVETEQTNSKHTQRAH